MAQPLVLCREKQAVWDRIPEESQKNNQVSWAWLTC